MDDIQFKIEALKVGLRDLLKPEGFFSICDFNKLCRMANIIPPDELVRTLDPLHCVHYRKMSGEFRDELQRRILDVFSVENQGFDMAVLEDAKPVAEPTRILQVEEVVPERNGDQKKRGGLLKFLWPE